MTSKKDILNIYYMDARCQLITIAAYLDRLDRHEGESDFREPALHNAIEAMLEPKEGETRAQAVLNALSDFSEKPAEKASIQFALGAPSGSAE